MPEAKPKQVNEDDEFRDPPDIRFPNQWERESRTMEISLLSLVRNSPGEPPRAGTKPLDSNSKRPSTSPTWPLPGEKGPWKD